MGELLVDGFRGDDRKSFTEEGVAKLIELLTQGEVEIIIENGQLVLRPEMADRTSAAAMKVKLANVIASTVDRLEQLSARDAHSAYCELYGLAGLLREGAELAEAEARAIEPRRWHGGGTAHFIHVGDEYEGGGDEAVSGEPNPE